MLSPLGPRSPVARKILAAAVAVTAGAAWSSPVASAAGPAPAGISQDAFYAPPISMVAGTPGSLVWWQRIQAGTPADLAVEGGPTARAPHTSYRAIFRSTDPDGNASVESAGVYVPTDRPEPAGGWKVVVFGHLTTGAGDDCAPTRASTTVRDEQGRLVDNPDLVTHLARGNELISEFLEDGHVVVQPDYAGIGTPGGHPYLVGSSLGKSMVLGARAGRSLIGELGGSASRQWVLAGQSEGGIAALYGSQRARELAPELDLKGTLSIVPPVDNARLVFGLGAYVPLSTINALGAMMLHGVAVDDPQIRAALHTGSPATSILTDEAWARWPDLENRCLDRLKESGTIGRIPLGRMFAPGAKQYEDRFAELLDASDPKAVDLGDEPVRFWTASLDIIAWPSLVTDAARYQRDVNGKDVDWVVSPWAGHNLVIDRDRYGVQMADWVDARLQG